MAINIKIKKIVGNFELNIEMQSDSNRIGILGASGCGKSMALKSIAGVEYIDEGYIEVDGRVLLDTKQRVNMKPQKRKIGYLFQNYALFPTKTVEYNIMAGLKGTKEQNKKRAREMMEKFQIQGLEARLPGELSGGQQQRVALARIMAYEPDMILLDEPFSALDSFLKDRLKQELLEMLDDYEGIIVLVSHSRDEIYQFTDELFVMENGKIVCSGPTREIFQNPRKVAAARLTGCKNIVPVERKDRHSFSIPNWKTDIYVDGYVPDNVKYIGYRAHGFIPVWGERGKNCIPLRLSSRADLPFEKKFFLESETDEEICWFVQQDMWDELEEKGMPNFLQINEDKLLYLS